MLDFAFSFAGHSFDETEVTGCNCDFSAEGDAVDVTLEFEDGAASGGFSWRFDDGNFGFQFVMALSCIRYGRVRNGRCNGRHYNFSIVPQCPNPARSRCSAWACSGSA